MLCNMSTLGAIFNILYLFNKPIYLFKGYKITFCNIIEKHVKFQPAKPKLLSHILFIESTF